MTSFVKRSLRYTLQLGEGSFGSSGSNKLTLSDVRSFAQISQAVTPTPGQALIRIYGLTLDQINTLTKAGLQFQAADNFVAIEAGDEGGTFTTVFNGTIYYSYPDFSSQPDVAFVVIANPANVIQLKPTSPVSFSKSVPVETALQQILQPAGYTVENNGVNAVLATPYFPGTVWQQVRAACSAADCYSYLDPVAKKLCIWPKTGSRGGSSKIIISPENGMIGYPEFMQNNIRIRNLFVPTLKGPGTPITVQSDLKAANGDWVLYQIDYNLSSEAPGGPWEMVLQAYPGTQQ